MVELDVLYIRGPNHVVIMVFHERSIYAPGSRYYTTSPKICRDVIAANYIGRIPRVQLLVRWNKQLSPCGEMLIAKTFARQVVLHRTCKRIGSRVRLSSVIYIVSIGLPDRRVTPDPAYSIKVSTAQLLVKSL